MDWLWPAPERARLPVAQLSWRQCVMMFTKKLRWLSARD
jgi:hypothetical protein